MQPEYRASITQQVPTCTDIRFDRPAISQWLRKRITDLAFFTGVTVREQPEGDGYYIITTPVWGSKAVPEEVLKILQEEGFDKGDILVDLVK